MIMINPLASWIGSAGLSHKIEIGMIRYVHVLWHIMWVNYFRHLDLAQSVLRSYSCSPPEIPGKDQCGIGSISILGAQTDSAITEADPCSYRSPSDPESTLEDHLESESVPNSGCIDCRMSSFWGCWEKSHHGVVRWSYRKQSRFPLHTLARGTDPKAGCHICHLPTRLLLTTWDNAVLIQAHRFVFRRQPHSEPGSTPRPMIHAG